MPALPPTVPVAWDASRAPAVAATPAPAAPPTAAPLPESGRIPRTAAACRAAPSRRPAAAGASAPARAPSAVPAGARARRGRRRLRRDDAGPRRPRRRRGRSAIPAPPAPPADAPEPPVGAIEAAPAVVPEPIGWQALAELAPDPLADPRAMRDAPAPAGRRRSAPTVPAPTVPPATARLAAAAAPAVPRATVPAAPAAPAAPQGEPPLRGGPRARCPAAAAGADRPDRGDHAAGVAACRRPVRLARRPAGGRLAPRRRRLMAGVTAIQGVDDTLKKLAADAVAGLSPKPDVTVGPLDRDADDLRLNWFLYRITPNPAYRNMEPPQTGWRTSRGRPAARAAAAVPADRVSRDDDERGRPGAVRPRRARRRDAGTARKRRRRRRRTRRSRPSPSRSSSRCASRSTRSTSSRSRSSGRRPPNRSGSRSATRSASSSSTPLDEHAAGPPVRVRRLAVAPTMGPRLQSVDPPRISFGDEVLVSVEGLTAGAAFTLARVDGDPDGHRGLGTRARASPARAGHRAADLATRRPRPGRPPARRHRPSPGSSSGGTASA